MAGWISSLRWPTPPHRIRNAGVDDEFAEPVARRVGLAARHIQ